MKKCLKISFAASVPEAFLADKILPQARSLEIEGTAQRVTDGTIRIIACGPKENIDAFLDGIHKELSTASLQEMEIEPFIKDKEYRGVFRIIE